MKQGNKVLCAVAALAAVGVMAFSNVRYCVLSDLKQYFISKINHITFTCAPETGISRSEMLKRFDGARLHVLLEYDKRLKGDVARWLYQIGDSDIFFTFKYSYDTGKVVEWRMQKDDSYKEWNFADYL